MRKSHDMWVSTSPTEYLDIICHMSPKSVRKRFSKNYYIDVTSTLDIETTNTDDDGFLYTIQMNIAGENCLVRYIEDYISIMDNIVEKWNITPHNALVQYIHNLGYEFFYMIQVLLEQWEIESALYVKPKKPLYIKFTNGITFRDSLRLFQKSLESATKGCKHAKLSGDLDYNKWRTPDTPLTPDEWNYCINDVQGLYEAIERLKKEHGYNAATIPLTNTAMVVEEVNKYVRKDGKTLKAMSDLELNKEQLKLAYNCMAGGDTHGTRWRSGFVFENCNSYDLKSAHPSQQLLRKFPHGKPFDLPRDTPESELKLLIANNHGWLGRVFIRNFKIKPECPDPTISVSKCEDAEGRIGADNGRLLGADGAIVYMDSNDYIRFSEAYDYEEFLAIEVIAFHLDYLPDSMFQAVFDKFKIKETMKNSPEYMFSKICVNTIFGALAQKVFRDEYTLTYDDIIDCIKLSWEDNLEHQEECEIHKRQAKKFPFLWGLWTASLSRLELWKLMKIVGWEKVIYWDTDSVKYEGEKIPDVDNVFNARVRDECIFRDAVVNNGDRSIYIGTAEDEHPDIDYGYRRFTFLHAKCYAAEAWNNKKRCYEIETTISGVRKENGADAMNGDISNLRDGFFIANAGGLSLSYHDRKVITRWDFKRPTRSASYIVMKPRQYLISAGIPDMIEERDDAIVC